MTEPSMRSVSRQISPRFPASSLRQFVSTDRTGALVQIEVTGRLQTRKDSRWNAAGQEDRAQCEVYQLSAVSFQ